jgi:prepilin-type N-terminal cleavage/methylation domain-containing protein
MTHHVARPRVRSARPAAASDAGFTLIEVMMAMMLLLIVAAGLLSVDMIATKTTENFGNLSARATEYAQDKMEQLQVLAYGNSSTDTTVFPANPTGGTGLAVGGGTNPAAPVTGYVDYLNQTGDLVTGTGGAAPANWYYIRVWQITSPSANLKQITVTVAIRRGFAAGLPMQSTVTALKTFPF